MTQPKENMSMDFCSFPVRRRTTAAALGSKPLKEASASASTVEEKKRSGARLHRFCCPVLDDAKYKLKSVGSSWYTEHRSAQCENTHGHPPPPSDLNHPPKK